VTTDSLEIPKTSFRNFNLCPHCLFHKQPALLQRLCEGMPMISRSDGQSFHFLLADRPLPYPLERSSGLTKKTSISFWYTPLNDFARTLSTIVIMAGPPKNNASLFRKIETIADLLAQELLLRGRLAGLYELFDTLYGPWSVPDYPILFDLPVPKLVC
jgi:hypothetical protein